MKKSKKLIAAAVAAVALFIGSSVKAQTTTSTTAASSPWRLGIGLEAGAPTGNAHTISNFELGGTARLQYTITDKFAWTLTSGYYNMFGKEVPGTAGNAKYQSLGIIPVKVGAKVFFAPSIYFGAEAGAGFETHGGTDTKLILSPGLGWASKSVDVGVRYENFSGQSNNYGLVGLRIAYGFGL
ncbi:MAG: hypothetical protein JWR67_3817 [Mucilaginibacter sp.]|nr:hypothetical protein [Mucilaginibacter sp.]